MQSLEKFSTENLTIGVRFCKSILRNQEDAEDAVANVVERFLRRKVVEEDFNLKSYWIVALRNECASFLRKNRPLPLGGSFVAPAVDLDSKVLLEQIFKFVRSLSEEDQRVFALMLEGESLGPRDRSRLSRLRRKLRGRFL